MRVLFIYPTGYKVTGLPIGLASIIAVLKEHGIEVRVFEDTFYPPEQTDLSIDDLRSKVGMSKRIENDTIEDNTSNVFDDLAKALNEFHPDIVGVSTLEPTYDATMAYLRHVRSIAPEVITAVGGVCPTFMPDAFINDDSVDAVCIGEGEYPFLEFCQRVEKGESFSNIPGIWTKKDGLVISPAPAIRHDVNELPPPDFRDFSDQQFMKPMQGRLRKMVNIETTRGCPFNCSYCAASNIKKMFTQNKLGSYFRKLTIGKLKEQLETQIERHQPEFIYFSSETFLALTNDEFNEFIDLYSDIRIPFWIQTRLETITYDRLARLKEVGLFWLTIGIEHGNEEYRKKVLRRSYSNAQALEAAQVLADLKQGASLNNIIGLPLETRELIFDTIELNRQLTQANPLMESNVFIFVPYRGTDLFDLAVREDLISPDHIANWSPAAVDAPALNYSQQWHEMLQGIRRTFKDYLHHPKSSYPLIQKAERMDAEGDAVFELLRTLPPEKFAIEAAKL